MICRLLNLYKFSAKYLLKYLIFSIFFFPGMLFSQDHKSYFLVYGGRYSHTTLLQILLRQYTDYDDSYIFTGAYSRQLPASIRDIYFETEGQLVKHFGIMNHLEMNALLIARYYVPVHFFNLSFALGEGVSMASKNPELENFGPDILKLRTKGERSRPVLNYIMVEMDFGIQKYPEIKLFTRIHHRSGIFGTYCPDICGSNFLAYGIKIKL